MTIQRIHAEARSNYGVRSESGEAVTQPQPAATAVNRANADVFEATLKQARVELNPRPVKSGPASSATGQMLDRARDSQFILLGDTEHGDAALTDFMGKQSTMAELKNHGVKWLGLEVRKEFQGAADALYESLEKGDGKVGKQDFVKAVKDGYVKAFDTPAVRAGIQKYMEGRAGRTLPPLTDAQFAQARAGLLADVAKKAEAQAQIIESAAKAGIRPLCLEEQKPDLVTHAAFLLDIRAAEERVKTAQGDAKASAVQARDALHSERDGYDKQLGPSILKKVGKEKTLVFYGASHGQGPDDLDEELAKLGTGAKRFQLFSSEEARLKHLQENEARPSARPAGALTTEGKFHSYEK